MDEKELESFREQLTGLRMDLLAQIASQRGDEPTRVDAAAAHFGHPEDSRAQLATERETEFALAEHEAAEVEAIDAAIKRLDAGTYGVCTDCAADIGALRLRAAPQALRCITCQQKFESRHKA